MESNPETMTEINNIYVIPGNNITLNSAMRKCSFCYCEGHNITRCNNNVLVIFNDYLIYLKEQFMILHNGNRILSIQEFENYLYDYCSQSESNIKFLKYVACRFYNTRLRSTLQITINQIILRLYDIDIAWVTFHEYNFVPFNQHTPVRIGDVLNGILLNYMSNEILGGNFNINNNNNNFDSNIIFTNYEIKLKHYDNNNNENIPHIECSICYNSTEKNKCAYFECKHEYCTYCVEQLINKKHTTCPYCRAKIKSITCYTEEIYNKLNNIVNSEM
uniref:RING-type domain-containing protein n=1 Tax=viral metagenome TaxID=1070528 RepID=A0A6C0JIW1_9ZZZZ